MKYFLDTEFHEYTIGDLLFKKIRRPTIELISIGIVAEDGREYYRISSEFDFMAAFANEWLRTNVIVPLIKEVAPSVDVEVEPWDLFHQVANAIEGMNKTTTNAEIAKEIKEFIGDDKTPEFYGYYADYDWVVFCWLFGRMIDLPKGFPMYCRDLKQMLDEKAVSVIHTISAKGIQMFGEDTIKDHPDYPKQENEHNALADARWNKSLYEFIKNINNENEEL